MVDSRFHDTGHSLSLTQIAELTGAALRDGAEGARPFTGVAPLHLAGPQDVAFLSGAAHLAEFRASDAGACFVTPALADGLEGRNLLICKDPQMAHLTLANALHPAPLPAPDISPAAHVHPGAVLGENISVGPGAVIGDKAQIDDGVQIGANTVVGPGVVIGADCRIGPSVTLTHALIGANVVIHSGARIGQAGFGYHPGAAGLVHIPQLGRVLIGDGVEIGANTTIDRGAGDDTVIGPGTKIDNLVQIGHNCRIGAHCVIVAQVGLSGSITVGDLAMLGGQVGVADHVTIGKGARIAAQSGVMKDIPAGATQGGYPARDIRDWHRDTVALKRLRGGGKPGQR